VRFVYEIMTVILEILGILLVSAGLGCVAAWWLGVAGLFTISGVSVLAFATLIAARQRAMNKPPPTTTGR
jgi:hypothetical protein